MGMVIEDAIRAKLIGTSAVTALVKRRIYPGVAPELKKNPKLVLNLVAETPHHRMGSDCVIREAHYEVACIADTYPGAKDVAVQVMTALQDSTGTWGTSGATINRCFFEGQRDEYDPTTDTHEIPIDFTIWYST